MYEIQAIDTGFIANEPGVTVTGGVTNIKRRGWFPMIVCNETERNFNLIRGNVVGRIEAINAGEIETVDAMPEPPFAEINVTQVKTAEELNAPEEFREALEKLTDEFRDIFAEI